MFENFFEMDYYKYVFNLEIGNVGVLKVEIICVIMLLEVWDFFLFLNGEYLNSIWDYYKYIFYVDV